MRFVEKMVAMHLRPIVLGMEKVTDSAVRRLLFDVGEDADSLLKLCRADITSKNKIKVARHLKNLEIVQEKLDDLKERDKIRTWQPVITGNHIMEMFVFDNPKKIGDLKNAVREAILEGQVPNELEPAMKFTLEKGEEMGLKRKS